MNDSYIIGQMNTFMRQLSEKMSDWLGDKLPKLTDNWWSELVYNNLWHSLARIYEVRRK